jgi:hypothetical protein
MSKYEKIITKLYPNPADAAIARSLIQRFSGDSRMDDGRLEAMLREGARANEMAGGGEMTPDQARELLSGFAESLGTPPDIMASLGEWWGSASDEAAAAETPPAQSSPQNPGVAPVVGVDAGKPAEQPASASPNPATARPAPASPAVDRAALQQEVTRWQAAMRAPEGSAEWRSYWKEGGSVAYGETLRALEALDVAPSPTPAAGAAAPAEPAKVTP